MSVVDQPLPEDDEVSSDSDITVVPGPQHPHHPPQLWNGPLDSICCTLCFLLVRPCRQVSYSCLTCGGFLCSSCARDPRHLCPRPPTGVSTYSSSDLIEWSDLRYYGLCPNLRLAPISCSYCPSPVACFVCSRCDVVCCLPCALVHYGLHHLH